jgi:hypothetical protein
MAPPPLTHYDALGVARGARAGEIVRAHDRLVAEFRLDTTPPDPRREALVHEAFAVLSDPDARAAYDRALDAGPAPASRRPVLAAGAAVAIAVAAGLYFLFSPAPPAAPAGRPVAEIAAEASRSVGRVRAFDMAGRTIADGVAFTVVAGEMATACEGLAPGSQLVVTIGTREVPARVSRVDEALGLCRLAVDGGGSWPLPAGGPAPRAGDKVYAAEVIAGGEVRLSEGTVRRVAGEGVRRLVIAAVPGGEGIGGRPLLDMSGRVVAAATAVQPGGEVRHVAIPPGWADEPAPAPAPAPVEPPPPAEAAKAGAAPDPIRRRAEEIAPKLAPPDTVPKDL